MVKDHREKREWSKSEKMLIVFVFYVLIARCVFDDTKNSNNGLFHFSFQFTFEHKYLKVKKGVLPPPLWKYTEFFSGQKARLFIYMKDK